MPIPAKGEKDTEKVDPQSPSAEPASDTEPERAAPAGLASSFVYNQTRTERGDPTILAEQRVIAGLRHDPRSAIFQLLRTQVLMRLRKKNWLSFAVTAALPEAGKSLIAANLAVGISQEVNQTVLLLDLDLRRPKIAKYFGLNPEFGVRDYLIDDVPLSKIFVNPGMERLVLLPGKGSVADSSELLTTPKALALVDEIKNRYESPTS